MGGHRKFSKWDDYLIHQTPYPIGIMGYGEGDPNWAEHRWLMMYPNEPTGPQIQAIWQALPNRRLMYAVMLVAHDDTQYILNACRSLDGDRSEATVGPMRHEVVEPLEHWRVHLDENEHIPVTMRLEYGSTGELEFWPLNEYCAAGASFTSQWQTFNGPLRVISGDVTIEGRAHSLTGYVGTHDHCWGRRDPKHAIGMHVCVGGWFAGRTIHTYFRDLPDGTPDMRYGRVDLADGTRLDVVDLRLDWEFDRPTRETILGTERLTLENGEVLTMTVKPCARGIYMNSAWIGEANTDRRDPYVTAEIWDLSDPDVLVARGPLMRDQHVQVEIDGEVGYGLLEIAVSKKHPVFGPQVR